MSDKSYWQPARNLAQAMQAAQKHFAVATEPLEVDGQILEILAITNMPAKLEAMFARGRIKDPLRQLPLWAKVWPASIILGRFLRKFNPRGKVLLELGCGMGICSLLASRWGFKKIIATDINSQALDFTLANIFKNHLENLIEAKYLDIGDPRANVECDMICASELLYLDELYMPILQFVKKCLRNGGQAIFCTDTLRDKPQFERMAKAEFKTTSGKIGLKGSDKKRLYNLLILEKA